MRLKVKCIKLIELLSFSENAEPEYGKFTIGEFYEWTNNDEPDLETYGEGYILNDIGSVHYMPSPLEERDPSDDWATSDYFEVVSE